MVLNFILLLAISISCKKPGLAEILFWLLIFYATLSFLHHSTDTLSLSF
ncbi:MAG: hypothetical protein QG673_548 [Pseudomonadota bacterium]|nr:hypothetical protein [Pseudomonadota bacterium]